MANRVRRRRANRSGLTACKLHELLTGELAYQMRGYDGYGDPLDRSRGDLADFITDEMREDWQQYRDEILRFWASGRWTCGDLRLTPASKPIRTVPWLFVCGSAGTRPWAWWTFDAPEPLGDGEDELGYLERHGLLRSESQQVL